MRQHLLRLSCAVAAVSVFGTLHCAAAVTFVVTTTADAGPGSLRHAITEANGNDTDDIIVFDLAGPGHHVIDLLSSLSITSNIEVLNDATTQRAIEPVTVQRSFAPGTTSFGLLFVSNGTRVTLAGLTLRNGSVGAVSSGSANLTLRDCVISGNSATSGGALAIDTEVGSFGPASITLLRCTFLNNAAQSGGAIYSRSENGALTITADQCVFRDNTASLQGGAIHSWASRLTTTLLLNECSLAGNTATSGGALFLTSGSGVGHNIVTMNRCILSDNVANGGLDSGGGGGGIHFASGQASAEIENCTFSDNVGDSGGAIDNAVGAQIRLRNATVAENRARLGGRGGGISCGGFGTCELSNTIVTQNFSGSRWSDIYAPSGPSFMSRGHNLIGLSDGNIGFIHGQNGDQVGTAAAPLGARLAPLRDNGGLTLTRSLLPGSPAINAGNDATAPPLDQRGKPRRGPSDIGAFEYRLIARAEFTRDGQSDIVWQNNASGQRAIWQMNGTAWTGERWLPVIPTEWQIATSGDFNSDGHTDLVWQNILTGVRAFWLMNGAEWVGERFLTTVPVQWQIVGSGEFNDDTHLDLVWQNTETGERAIWLMNGTVFKSAISLPFVPLEWVVAAVEEFTGDGHLDILWQNVTTGQVAIWRMKGIEWVGEHFLPTVPVQWRIAGSGDFNGDSHADILWQNDATGQRAIWRMNGTQWVGETFLPTIPLEWRMRNH